MSPDRRLEATRRSLHGFAELVLAGPQHAAFGTIRLRVTPGGFATVTGPDRRVQEVTAVNGAVTAELGGRSVAEVAAELGVVPSSLGHVYAGGSGMSPEDRLSVDAVAARVIEDALGRGDAALRAFAPQATPVLWPEHLDVAIAMEEVNFGVSPGDAEIPTPYAYVGPWEAADLDDPFWNVSYGAARPLDALGNVVSFFEQGRDLAGTAATARPRLPGR